MLAFATLGVLVSFFYYNVFGNAKHGRKIFMGDTGSLTIGMMLCFLSLKLTMCGLDDNTGNVHPMVLASHPCWSMLRCGPGLPASGTQREEPIPAGQEPHPP